MSERRIYYWISAGGLLYPPTPDYWAGLPVTDLIANVDGEGHALYQREIPAWSGRLELLRTRLRDDQRLHLSVQLAPAGGGPMCGDWRWWGRFCEQLQALTIAAAGKGVTSFVFDAEPYKGRVWPREYAAERGRDLARATAPFAFGCQGPLSLVRSQPGFWETFAAACETVQDGGRAVTTYWQDPYTVHDRRYGWLRRQANRLFHESPQGERSVALGLAPQWERLEGDGLGGIRKDGWADPADFRREARKILRHGDLWLYTTGDYFHSHPQAPRVRKILERLLA